VALFRPGHCIGGDDFITAKQGREFLSYPHPNYQLIASNLFLAPDIRHHSDIREQVMQIAPVHRRYTLGGADMLPPRHG